MNKFEPFPKNPPISKIFREIGYAGELGSGMRNTNKYTKLYSGGTPIFVEDNIFEILIPIGNVAELRIGPEETGKETAKTSKETVKTNKERKRTNKEIANTIIEIIESRPEISVNKMAEILNVSISGVRYHIDKMKRAGIIEHIGPTKKGKWIVHK